MAAQASIPLLEREAELLERMQMLRDEGMTYAGITILLRVDHGIATHRDTVRNALRQGCLTPSLKRAVRETGPFGARLRECRLRAEMTQDEVARAVFYADKASVGQWERGRYVPPTSTVTALAELFGVDSVWLIGGRS